MIQTGPEANVITESFNYTGDANGYGTIIVFEDGRKFTGSLKNGKSYGWGNITYQDGSTYEGEWINGNMNGYGTYLSAEKTYTGTWKDNKADGCGRMSYPDGSYYVGQFREGNRHGNGTNFWASDGRIYTGRF